MIPGRLSKSGSLLLVIALFTLSHCGERTKTVSSPELAREIRNRELRHITPSQITQATFQNGEKVSGTLQEAITRKLMAAIGQEGLVKAARYCQLNQLSATDSLEKEYTVAIKRIRLIGQSASVPLTNKEKELLEAYQYSVRSNQPVDPNVQQDNTYMLYTAPISLSSQTCLKCHGIIGKEISQQDWETLSSNYKMDSLVNLKSNQTIAIWSLLFDKKELVKRIGE